MGHFVEKAQREKDMSLDGNGERWEQHILK